MDYPKTVPGAGLVAGRFVDENTATGTPGSLMSAAWGNAITDEILNTIIASGLAPDETKFNQLSAAIVRLVGQNTKDPLNTTRVDVASAATVNLTTAAGDSRHINLTGSTAITKFTVAVGRCYFVRFDGSIRLTVGANISTNTGYSINAANGDTCIIRATAADVVEVLAFSPTLAPLDTVQVNFSSSAAINLTTDAPDTRHILLAGSGTITGFTVLKGRCYLARFNGAARLVNGAAIITSTGADIVAAAGDSCWLIATAANVVEVVGYTRGRFRQKPDFESTGLAITNAGRLTVAHGLGAKPSFFEAVVRCKAAISNIAIGDEIKMDAGFMDSNAANTTRGAMVSANATNLLVQFGYNTAIPIIASDGGYIDASNTNFEVVLRAWA